MDIILMESIHPTPSETTPPINEPAEPIFSAKVQFSGKGGEFLESGL